MDSTKGLKVYILYNEQHKELWFKVKYGKCHGEGATDDLENLRGVILIAACAARNGVVDQGTFELGHFLCWTE